MVFENAWRCMADGYSGKAPARIQAYSARAEYWFEERCFINELCNDPLDPAASIARARVEPGVTTRLHRLHGITERYVVLSGAGEVEVGGQPPCRVEPGDVVLIPPECPQRIRNAGDEDLVFLAVCTPRFRPEAYEDLEARAET